MTTTLAQSGLSSTVRLRIKRLQALIFGPYKSGKTIMAHHMPRTRTIDFDDGMQSVEFAILQGIIEKEMNEIVYETILAKGPKDDQMLLRAFDQIKTWIEEEDIASEEWEEYCCDTYEITPNLVYPQYWDTLIIDSMSNVNEASMIRGLKENKRLDMSKSWDAYLRGVNQGDQLAVKPMRIQDWGAARSIETKFVEQLRTLGKNLLILCHEYTDQDQEGVVRAVEPLLIGGGRQDIPRMFDEVWYCITEGTRQKPQWKFQTTPAGRVRCGTRLGCLEPIEEANFPAIKKKIAEFYGVDEDLLWSAAHGVAEVEAEMAKEVKEQKMI